MNCNFAVIAGNLTRDIELKYTRNGNAVASFSVAVNRSVKQADGTYKNEAVFIPVVVWGRQAEACGRYLSKGDNILVEGRINQRSYETQSGEKRYVVEVVAEEVQFPPRKDSARDPAQPPDTTSSAPRRVPQSARGGWPDEPSAPAAPQNTRANFEPEDADIPF